MPVKVPVAANTHKVTFNPNPFQKRFIESRAKADLFSSRMGEGKSTGLAWAALYHTRHNPGARWALIRDTWETTWVSSAWVIEGTASTPITVATTSARCRDEHMNLSSVNLYENLTDS